MRHAPSVTDIFSSSSLLLSVVSWTGCKNPESYEANAPQQLFQILPVERCTFSGHLWLIYYSEAHDKYDYRLLPFPDSKMFSVMSFCYSCNHTYGLGFCIRHGFSSYAKLYVNLCCCSYLCFASRTGRKKSWIVRDWCTSAALRNIAADVSDAHWKDQHRCTFSGHLWSIYYSETHDKYEPWTK